MFKVLGKIQERLVKVEAFVEAQMVKAIVKQAGKIQKDPTDIKMIDIDEAIGYWSEIVSKTPELEEMYKVIQAWYTDNK